MSKTYTIEWVGDDARNYKGINSWAVAGKDEDGNEFKKTKLELPESAGKPQTPYTFEGALVDHPRLDSVKLLTPNGAGVVASSGGTSAPASDKDAQIARAVAFKGAIEIVAAAKTGATDDEIVARVDALAEKLIPVVDGTAGPTEQTTDGDESLPF